MSGRKKDEKTASIPEVKEIMEILKERWLEINSDEGMSHFQEITYNYVNKFAKFDAKTANKIKKRSLGLWTNHGLVQIEVMTELREQLIKDRQIYLDMRYS